MGTSVCSHTGLSFRRCVPKTIAWHGHLAFSSECVLFGMRSVRNAFFSEPLGGAGQTSSPPQRCGSDLFVVSSRRRETEYSTLYSLLAAGYSLQFDVAGTCAHGYRKSASPGLPRSASTPLFRVESLWLNEFFEVLKTFRKRSMHGAVESF